MSEECETPAEKLEQLQRKKIISETSKISWLELQDFFAKGLVVYVSQELNLIDVAYVLANDDAETFAVWVNENKILRDFDKQAAVWVEKEALVWCVVVKPWVLVQSVEQKRLLN